MNWQAIGAVSTGATGIIILLSVIALTWQIRELRRTTAAQTFDTIIRHLQNEDTRKARRHVFSLKEKDLSEWDEKDIFAVEKFCHSYDSVAIMIRHGLLPRNMFLDNWGDSIDRGSTIVMPLIEKYREDRRAPETWDDFVWLSEQARVRLRKLRRK